MHNFSERIDPGRSRDDETTALLETDTNMHSAPDTTSHLAKLLNLDPQAARSFSLTLGKYEEELAGAPAESLQSLGEATVKRIHTLFMGVDTLVQQKTISVDRALEDAQHRYDDLIAKPIPSGDSPEDSALFAAQREERIGEAERDLAAQRLRREKAETVEVEWRSMRADLLAYVARKAYVVLQRYETVEA